MAYLLRSLAVIGVIALNSPVHGGKAEDGGAADTLRNVAKAASQVDVRTVANGAMAAREAAEILATDAFTIYQSLGLAAHLTPQRSNGVRAMIERIKTDARRAVA